MGFYIHSCHKMRYKGEYEPSEILCPSTLRFCYLKSCLAKLEKNVFIQLSDEKEIIIDDHNIIHSEFEDIFKSVRLEIRGENITLHDFLYKWITKSYLDQYKLLFIGLVMTFGKSTVKNVLFKY